MDTPFVCEKSNKKSIKGQIWSKVGQRSIKGWSKVSQGHTITDGQLQRSNQSKAKDQDQELTKVCIIERERARKITGVNLRPSQHESATANDFVVDQS
jgi:hypothetical protein